MHRIYDWSAIQRYHDEGHGFVECRNYFGVTHTAWNKAIRRGELRTAARPFRDRRRRYDWAEVQAYYDDKHSLVQCMNHFGFARETWHKAVKRGEIRPRPLGLPIAVLLEKRGSRRNVKWRLLREGLLENRCQICGISEWQGQPLSIHLDHINGVRNDHRFENLRMLCPNCHSQTDTYGAKNRRKRRLQEATAAL